MGGPTCQMLTKTKAMSMHLAVTAHLSHESEVLQMVIWKEIWKRRS